jgi:hypothetical protein
MAPVRSPAHPGPRARVDVRFAHFAKEQPLIEAEVTASL